MYLLLDWQGSSLIGGRYVDGIWRWQGRVTEEIGYDWWADNQPSGDGDCMNVDPYINYKFNDIHCTFAPLHFFCEKATN